MLAKVMFFQSFQMTLCTVYQFAVRVMVCKSWRIIPWNDGKSASGDRPLVSFGNGQD